MITKIVCIQLTKCIEDNNLLPKSQHGFRKMRSTMTAHSNMQQQWFINHFTILAFFISFHFSFLKKYLYLRDLNKIHTYIHIYLG